MNDAGLVANALYLVETDYGDAKASGKPLISVGVNEPGAGLREIDAPARTSAERKSLR